MQPIVIMHICANSKLIDVFVDACEVTIQIDCIGCVQKFFLLNIIVHIFVLVGSERRIAQTGCFIQNNRILQICSVLVNKNNCVRVNKKKVNFLNQSISSLFFLPDLTDKICILDLKRSWNKSETHCRPHSDTTLCSCRIRLCCL